MNDNSNTHVVYEVSDSDCTSCFNAYDPGQDKLFINEELIFGFTVERKICITKQGITFSLQGTSGSVQFLSGLVNRKVAFDYVSSVDNINAIVESMFMGNKAYLVVDKIETSGHLPVIDFRLDTEKLEKELIFNTGLQH